MQKISYRDLEQIFQTKTEFIKIITLGGKFLLFPSFINRYIGYYVPPKKDIDYMFVKGFFNKKKKVKRSFFYENIKPIEQLLKEKDILYVKVPRYEEFEVKSVWNQIKGNQALNVYFKDYT